MGARMEEPILIMALPRSGSSMTAGIFHAHGVWVGACRAPNRNNPKGHFESNVIRDALISTHGAIVHAGELAKPVPGFREAVTAALEADGYEGGPWLWKGSCLYWPAWFEFSPQWIVVRRPKDATFRSCRSSQVFGAGLSDERLQEVIDIHHRELDKLVTEHGAIEVDTDAVANGDDSTVRRAIERCGLTFDAAITDHFVDKALWHFGSRRRTG